MATNSRQELDKKTKKLSSSGRIELGKEHAAYQETQQQLLAILAERQQNLAVARAESQADSNLNQTLAQAAELGAVSAAEAEQAAMAGGEQTVNPATLAVLNKYGMGKPRILRAQSHNQQVTKQNITINNNNSVTTKNDVHVPAGIGGPLQGRPVQFRPQAKTADSTGKFKAWISSAFARLKEEGARRDREYRHRESSLTKSASRMMKKLEEIGKTIGTRMDPRKIGSTWTSQIKTLLFLFGFGYLANNWVKILGWVEKIADWIKGTWEYFTDDSKGETKFTAKIRSLLGGEQGETLALAFGRLLVGEDGLWGLIKAYFNDFIKDRADAIKLVKFPELEWSDLDNPIEAFKKILGYLGNLITVAIGGSESAEKAISSQIRSNADLAGRVNALESSSVVEKTGEYKTSEGDLKADQGIENIIRLNLKGNYTGITHHTLDDDGNISREYGAEAGYSVSSDILRLNKLAESGDIRSGEISRDFERLYNAAKVEESEGNTGVVVSNALLNKYLSNEEKSQYMRENKIKNIQYFKVLRKKNNTDKSLEGTDAEQALVKAFSNKAVADAIGVGDYSPRTLATLTGGTLVGAGVGLVGGPIGALIGAYLGKKVGDIINSKEARAVIDYLYTKFKDIVSNDYRVEYVRQLRDGDIPILDDKGNNAKTTVIEAGSEVVQSMANKAAGSQEPVTVSSTNKQFVTSLEDQLRKPLETKLKEKEEAFNKKYDGSGKYGQKELATAKGEEPTWWVDKRKVRNAQDRAEVYRLHEDYLKEKEEIATLRENLNKSDNNSQLYSELESIQKSRKQREDEFNEKLESNRVYKMANEWEQTFDEVVSPIANLVTNVGGRSFNIKADNKTVDNATLKYRKQYLMKALTGKGLSKAAAAGIIGNLEGEGLKNPTDRWTRDPNKAHPDGKSVGIAQFHNYGMFPALEKWAKDRGRRWEDFETLADFIAEHAVTKKIANLTKNLSPQDSLKKSAIIWGRDFEVFTGHDAADKNYNIVGRGTRNSSGQYGDENYANRIKMGLTTYNNYSNENLDSITLQTGSGSDGPVIPGTVDQRWVMCVNDVTKWYNKSIPTYNGGNGSPKYYKSKWGEVRDDCSGLVSVCISAYTESSFDSDSTNLSFKDNEIGKKLEGAGFGYIKFTSWGALKPYDIIVSQGHTEIYAGNINGLECSFSWGSLHNTKTNPSGPPWPSDKSKEYKVIWRNGSGSGPDFMYNNGILSLDKKDNEPTSFISIMFKSITESLKNFSQGLAASNNDVVSAFGKGFGELVEKAELIVGKTEEVKDEIKNKKLPDSKTINNTSTSNVKMDLNNLTEKDYTLLRELVKSHTINGIVDIGGFTKELNDKYGIDLKKWYLTGDVEKKRQLIKNLFGFDPYSNNLTLTQSNIISGLELPKPSFGREYLDYQLVTNGDSVLPHIGTNFASTSIDNFKFSTDSLFAPPVLNKDTSFIDEVNKNREETSVALQDNATLTSRTIAGGIDHLSNVIYQSAQYLANVFKGSSNKRGLNFVKVDSSINQTEALGIGYS